MTGDRSLSRPPQIRHVFLGKVAGEMVVLNGGVCRSRVTQREAYGVFGLALLFPLRHSHGNTGMLVGTV